MLLLLLLLLVDVVRVAEEGQEAGPELLEGLGGVGCLAVVCGLVG